MKLLSRLVLVITLTATAVAAQTKVTPPKNKYTPQQDVQIGREAAAEVRQAVPDHQRIADRAAISSGLAIAWSKPRRAS